MRSRAIFLVAGLVVTGLFGGATASSVTAATSTKVTWKVSSLTAGQIKSLSAVATSNSPGVKTWSKTGSCTLYPTRKPTTLMMGLGADCTLTLQIARSGKYPAKRSEQTIIQKSTAPTTTTTVAPTTTTTTVAPLVYNVGDTGPSGGIIFYKDLTRAAGSQYFEAACAGWSDGTCGGSDLLDPQVAWGCYGMLIFGADGLAIGDGEANTADIIADCAYAGIAARIAGDSSLGGQDDWFLPSRGELNALCKWAFNDNRNEVCNNNGDGGRVLTNGGFHPGAYQSSSEISMDSMWGQGFNNGNYIGDLKRLPGNLVRPVRSF